MQNLQTRFEQIDYVITQWMADHGVTLLRMSVGIIFLWFGGLKLFPNLSPAEGLATQTIEALTFGVVTPSISLPVLAVWEVIIGIGLLSGRFLRITLLLLFLQMMGTVTPLVLFPNEAFTVFPIGLTLEGQYIIKNLVLISAGIVIGATVRGGNLVADPEKVDKSTRELKLQRDTQ
ncbi:MAG: hypothetical protein CUN56_14750 [Phototrophicales bacterium]|nr:MAG: hypothetical protein CUN56_14750 [Phototrophicales bacterium]